jgi:hypothetical protein
VTQDSLCGSFELELKVTEIIDVDGSQDGVLSREKDALIQAR